MPLVHGKSDKAFSENVSREMDAGKPQKQAVAIAYSVKREASHKKMGHGGEVDGCPDCMGMEEGGYVEGGEVQGPSDDEMYEHCAGELMEALEKKDKRGALEALRAILMSNRSE